AALRALGHAVVEVARVGEEGETPRPTILETIRSGEVTLVVNTPSPQPGPVRDAASIRLAAIAEGILCLTALETALAAAHSLEPQVRERMAEVRPLGEWQPGPARAVTVMALPG
ncbi:MAG: hypothetical protein ACRDGL_04125, partial [Candidatus Limnocylindrales bacterium]